MNDPTQRNFRMSDIPREHLLGRLSDEDRNAADERSIVDPEYFEALIAAEEFLIEEYAASRLSGADKRDFERQVEDRPDLQDRIALERTLLAGLEPRPPVVQAPTSPRTRPPSALRSSRMLLSLAASLMVVAGAGIILYLSQQLARERSIARQQNLDWQRRDAEYRGRVSQLEALAQERKGESGIGEPEKKGVPSSGPLLASLLVQPYVRGNENPRFAIPHGTGRVQLNLSIDPDTQFSSYQVVVTSAGVRLANMVTPAQVLRNYRVVSVTVSVAFTSNQRFEATVSGVRDSGNELVEAYSFVLERSATSAPGREQ